MALQAFHTKSLAEKTVEYPYALSFWSGNWPYEADKPGTEQLF